MREECERFLKSDESSLVPVDPTASNNELARLISGDQDGKFGAHLSRYAHRYLSFIFIFFSFTSESLIAHSLRVHVK